MTSKVRGAMGRTSVLFVSGLLAWTATSTFMPDFARAQSIRAQSIQAESAPVLTAAADNDATANVLDPVPAPIEAGQLPDVIPEPTAEPLEQTVQPDPVVPVAPVAAMPVPSTPFAQTLLAGLKPIAQPKRKKDASQFAEADKKRQLWRFYAERGGEPVWLKDGRFSDPALQVVAEISKAADWGLDPKQFDIPVSLPAAASIDSQIDVELKFTQAVLDYARVASTGQFDPIKISDLIDRMSTAPAPYAILKAVSESTDVSKALVSFHPQHPQFEKLRQAYLALKDGTATTATIAIPEGPKLKPGTSHPHIALLRKRLNVPVPQDVKDEEGDPAEFYDPALVVAVKAAQSDRGMKSDGVFGRSLRQSLNGDTSESNDKRIERILANMERWRWLPTSLGDLYVLNNIPDYLTRFVKNDQIIFTERIVIGRPTTPTSVFSDRMDYVEFNPFWNVPNSIKINELLPSIQRNGGGALRRQGLRVKYAGRDRDPEDLDWSRIDMRNVQIFQPPSAGNALGRIKFMFPNKHDIYMHDTPSKSLFNETARAFSHGCMRVRNPALFAEAILREANAMSPEEVQAEFASVENKQLPLERKIPVHVTYFTAWVDDDGTVSTKSDVYSHDRRTTLALAGRFDDIDRQEAIKPDFQSAAVSRQRVANSNQNNNSSLFSIFDAVPGDNDSSSGGAWQQKPWLR
jgi:L,D-transpeptidase YcbB